MKVGLDFELTHRNVSFVKSGLRIIGALTLMFGSLLFCGVFLILAEALGIVEEVVEND
jgi:hypothetical protein